MYLWEVIVQCAVEKRAAVHETAKFRIRYMDTLIFEELGASNGYIPVTRDAARKTWPKIRWFMGEGLR